ncbi:GntR family transcriptional regulator [Nocardia camponoti]|uniref:GntR family transcriptional regulator n=1 Tax=Nocardia camponoti TaxID=1616106 RepID=A0A917V9E3_9NOCA|nr:GntR family transcriptional regulator [Nocardia camponoti]GGK51403.1 GntR family transcriptional regulator [Nocardia camponoti]
MRGSLAQYVYEALRVDLTRFDPTQRLAAEPLARRYGVSRTPVREALARLVADGLVVRRRGGLFVHQPPAEQVAELYELRMVLELRGIERVREREVMRDELARWNRYAASPPTDALAADEQFHLELLGATGNSALPEALFEVFGRLRAARSLDRPDATRLAAMTTDHVAIARAVLAGDTTGATTLLTNHIRSGHERLARALNNPAATANTASA